MGPHLFFISYCKSVCCKIDDFLRVHFCAHFSLKHPFKIAQQGRLNKVRSAAAYKAITSGDYDVLVHPNYSTTVEDYFFVKKYAVTVEGYGAKYSNFRTERQKVIITGNNKEYIIPDID